MRVRQIVYFYVTLVAIDVNKGWRGLVMSGSIGFTNK